MGELIRNALEHRLAQGAKPKRDPLFADDFTFTDNGPPDVAANLDKYLGEMADEDYRREQRK